MSTSHKRAMQMPRSTRRTSSGTARPRTPYAEPFHGVEGVRRLIQEVRESLDGFRTEPFEYLDGGDFVVAGLTHRGRGKGSDAEVEMREWNVFLIERGKIVSVHEYSDREAALRAAGLSE